MFALDIETEIDTRRPSSQRMTCASTVDIESGHLTQYDESSALELVSLLIGVDKIIGYNVLAFDLRVLSDYAGFDLRRRSTRNTLDLYRDLVQRTSRNDISLDELARGTLHRSLPSHGGDLYSLGQLRRLRENSANGTREIAAIYRFGRANQFVRWQNDADGRLYEIPVLWT